MSDLDAATKDTADSTLFPTKFSFDNQMPDGGLAESAARCRDIVANAYRAMLHGNEGALAEILHPDVVFKEARGLPYGIEAKGVEGALKGVQGMFSYWSQVDMQLVDVLGGKDMAIAYMNMRFTSQHTGKVYEGPVAEVFRFQGDQVIEWYPIYWDTKAVREACGID